MSGETFEGMTHDIEQEAGGLAQTARDLFAGAVGGIAQVLVGQPFDIVKVRLQTTKQYTGALDAVSKIYANEGPLAFYKGTLTPLIGIGACVSVQFGAFNTARRYFEQSNLAAGAPAATLSLPQFYAAGAFAGVTNTFLSSPIEHVRIRLQTQPHARPLLYPSPWACIKTLCSPEAGGVRGGLYRGASVTLLREAQAYGCWFLTYELLLQSDIERRGLASRADMETWRLGVYGGLAGEALWLGSYPFDVVKSRMQTDGLLVPGQPVPRPAGVELKEGWEAEVRRKMGERRYKSMRDCFAQTWREDGIKAYWRGIGPTLARAMPVSAATFVVAELTLRAITPKSEEV